MTGANNNKLKIFSGRANRPLAESIARHLGVPLGNLNLGNFPDGESSVRIDEDVRGRDVFIVQPTCPPVNENLMELLIILDAFKRASPARVTAVIPYYGYARQDRKDTGRVPISAKLVADLLTTAGAHRVLCLDLHAAQIQGFFNIPVDHLYAVKEVTAHVRTLGITSDDLVVLSTDEGNVKKALLYQRRLGGQIAVVDKRRASAEETKAAHLIGAPLVNKTVVIFDDMISTASSMVNAVEVARKQGAKKIYVCATHGLLCGPAVDRLREAPVEQIAVTDSIPISKDKLDKLPNLKQISVAPLMADAIRRIHGNESISDLFKDETPPVERRGEGR
ncbi:ribose-phosphate diphosphokinase [Fimbriiglobus ruber]|uniref:Ribose-phosphate pyrophosphokinase n=1 Tax=Fimbriiglobus ruber TaxID=1908690 RepID=A0A225DK82_9BACT|nr:ribose-phosphate pyrophosphokinase [Fimbriiglobus ruber]OWK36795.1 Ribose-phosphate pyrophosphokinase [Fimbriiglobus ruber]